MDAIVTLRKIQILNCVTGYHESVNRLHANKICPEIEFCFGLTGYPKSVNRLPLLKKGKIENF